MATGVKSGITGFSGQTDEMEEGRTHHQERQRELPSFPADGVMICCELYWDTAM